MCELFLLRYTEGYFVFFTTKMQAVSACTQCQISTISQRKRDALRVSWPLGIYFKTIAVQVVVSFNFTRRNYFRDNLMDT